MVWWKLPQYNKGSVIYLLCSISVFAVSPCILKAISTRKYLKPETSIYYVCRKTYANSCLKLIELLTVIWVVMPFKLILLHPIIILSYTGHFLYYAQSTNASFYAVKYYAKMWLEILGFILKLQLEYYIGSSVLLNENLP